MQGEKILDVFKCALSLKIHVQGTIHVSNMGLYFHSYFTDSLIFFGKETKLQIPFKDVKEVNKAKNAKIFDNSISLKLSNGIDLFFTNFISRDKCFSLIMEQLRNSN